MAMTVKRTVEKRFPSVVVQKVADIRGGVSVSTSSLGGQLIREGAVVSAPVDGICYLIKTAALVAEASSTDTTISVDKYHNFQVGDVVFAEDGGTAVTISAIDTSAKKYDVLTLSGALGVDLAEGDAIAEGAEAGSAGALKYEPFAVIGTGGAFINTSNFITDAWVIGVTCGNALPSFVQDALKGIINY